ncbi:Uncharacterized protein Rs2_18887 [Raphanus sativus]|nr:Uncharacterized protein Rs2_18887 [Raphanus sativus]
MFLNNWEPVIVIESDTEPESACSDSQAEKEEEQDSPYVVFSENSVIHGFIHAARATVHLYEATETVPSIYSGFTMPLWRNPSDAFQIVAYSLCQSVALVLIHFCRCGGCNGFRKQS